VAVPTSSGLLARPQPELSKSGAEFPCGGSLWGISDARLPVDVRAASTVSATSAENPHLEVDSMPPSVPLSPFGPVSAQRRTLSPARPTLLEEATGPAQRLG
jgi:hypothetical protein